MPPLNNIFFLIITCITVSVLINQIVIKFGKVVLPCERSSHSVPTAVGAGIGFIICFFLYLINIKNIWSDFFYKPIYFDPLLNKFAIGTLILGIVGLIDDYKGLSYKIRLIVHFTCASILVNPANFEDLFLIFCVVGLINSTNFVDGLNGLLSGCWLIGIFFSVIMLYLSKDFDLIIALLPIFVSVLVFFFYNFPKAKIFMGDVGSTFLGFSLGLLLVITQKQNSEYFFILNKKPIIILMPFAFLWFDVFFTLFNRIKNKVSITYSHKDYIFHKLVDKGFFHTKISLLYFLLTLIISILTFLYFTQTINFIFLLIIYSCFQFFIILMSRKNK